MMAFNGQSGTRKLLQAIIGDPIYSQLISEWVKIEQISNVSIGGGVQV